MYKTIKFNLPIDGTSVRNLKDLQHHFVTEEILELYHNGLLARWLKVRGYQSQLDLVQKIDSTQTNLQICEALVHIFGVELDTKKVREQIEILQYEKEKQIIIDDYFKRKSRPDKIIREYHDKYEALIERMITEKYDMVSIKVAVNELEKNYLRLFHLGYYDLYYRLKKNAPLAIFAILMNSNLRRYFVGYWENGNHYFGNHAHLALTKSIYENLCKVVEDADLLEEMLEDEVCTYSRKTEPYWEDVVSPEQKVLVLRIGEDSDIKSYRSLQTEYDSDDVKTMFLLLDGISYRSSSDEDELLYLEV